jgi:DNA-3-methyladenine glycosylase II
LTIFWMETEPPFDFERSASIHGRFQKSLPDLYEDKSYRRVLRVSGKPVLATVSSKGTIQRPRLKVEARPRLSTSEREDLRKQLHDMFAPTFDFKRFCQIAKQDRLMNAISIKLTGLRPIPPPSVFEALVIAITEQQISLDAAMAIRSRLIEKYGDRLRFEERIFYAFPTPRSLAKTKTSQMRTVGLSRNKTRYIIELAKRVENGELELERLRTMNDKSAIAELTKIKGVGPWSAEYALIRGMGRVNSLPADDLGIQRAVSQAYFGGRRVSSRDVRRVLGKFAPFSGIAGFYLMYYLFWLPRSAPWNHFSEEASPHNTLAHPPP